MLATFRSIFKSVLLERPKREVLAPRTSVQKMMRLSPAGQIARGLAAARALETEGENPLFNDPFARQFAGTEGFTSFAESQAQLPKRATNLFRTALSIRTRYYDEAVQAAMERGIRQLILFSAGFDTRAFRLSLPQDLTLWELDQAEIFEAKEPVFERIGATPDCKRFSLALDICEDWTATLEETGFQPSLPTAFLLEGVLVYLNADQVKTLLDRIDAVAAFESWIGFDVVGRSLLEFGPFRRQREWVEARGRPFLFSSDNPESLASERGWIAQSAVPGEQAADFGRWPFPAFPRSIPGIPRNYYVSATKDPNSLRQAH